MKGESHGWLRRLFAARALSPTGLVVRALLIVIVFAICHAAGLREHTTFLSGTPAAAEGSTDRSVFLGMIYIAVYLAFVLITPILALAAVFLGLWQNCAKARRSDLSVAHLGEDESNQR